MSYLLCCFSGNPHPDDPFGARAEKFNVSLKDAACKDPLCCVGTFCCPYCVIGKLRYDYLREDMSQYICCQGVIPDMCCFKPGRMGEKDCPMLCLCCEAVCCPGLSMSSTRIAVMSDYNLGSDPFDRKLIRCVNCLQMAACLCRCAAAFEPSCEDAADAVSCVADLAFWSVMGCMGVQISNELKIRNHKTNGRGFSAPMQRDAFGKGGRGRGGGGHNNNRNRQQQRAPQPQTMHRGGGGNVVGTQGRYQQGAVVQQQQPQPQMMQVQCPQGAGPGTGKYCIVVLFFFGVILFTTTDLDPRFSSSHMSFSTQPFKCRTRTAVCCKWLFPMGSTRVKCL
jgi:hypothetical protein